VTALSNGHKLPELPSGEAQAQSAQRARSVPDTPPAVTDSDRRWRFPAIGAVLSGASLLAAQPPSLVQAWAWHRQAAGQFAHRWARWPRLAWGAAHVALAAVLRAVEWVTGSPPKLLAAVAVAAACWFWS
jgi:hypothetical protein